MPTRTIILILMLVSFSKTGISQSFSKETILISTIHGNIKLKLFNETPLHRDNFLKLVKEHFYDSLLFHRVIEEFMIQGGDPDSRFAAVSYTHLDVYKRQLIRRSTKIILILKRSTAISKTSSIIIFSPEPIILLL